MAVRLSVASSQSTSGINHDLAIRESMVIYSQSDLCWKIPNRKHYARLVGRERRSAQVVLISLVDRTYFFLMSFREAHLPLQVHELRSRHSQLLRKVTLPKEGHFGILAGPAVTHQTHAD